MLKSVLVQGSQGRGGPRSAGFRTVTPAFGTPTVKSIGALGTELRAVGDVVMGAGGGRVDVEGKVDAAIGGTEAKGTIGGLNVSLIG